MSLVEVRVTFEVEGGPTLRGVLKKSLAPLTVRRLLTSSPHVTRCYFLDGRVAYFPLGLVAGEEKSTYEVKRGDIFYWIAGKSLCVALEDVRFPQRVNLLGRLEDPVEALASVRSGSSVTIRLEE